jgi:uncharacterized SAM-binding protein YcdF (DUF218 family)
MFASLARGIGFLTMTVLVGGLVAFGLGFFWFINQVPSEEIRLADKADGIVVLTGAASRIPDAIELLNSARGQRVLITGVNRTTTAKEIANLTSLNERIFRCCVDLDRSALNTLGNAIETRRWARDRNFHSLIIVTSNWHMPRAMAEIEHQMPDAKLIAYPVVSEKIKGEPWWSSSGTTRLLLSEYLKYVFAVVRMRLDPDVG